MPISPTYGGNSYTSLPYYSYPIVPQQMPYQNNVRSVIPGRSVVNVKEITSDEVPMDGSLALFPKKDESAIYVRSYNGKGTIDTKIYIPAPSDYVDEDITPERSTISNEDILKSITDLANRVDNIQGIVNTLTKNNNRNQNPNKNHNKQNPQTQKDEINA